MEDPWSSVTDLDGLQHYRTLGVGRGATDAEIRHGYKRLARQLHPDKGGDAESFARLRDAFELLSDPGRRAVYDRWASDVRYRYVAGTARSFDGAEDELLKHYERSGIRCDPATQLIRTCEVCRRPATKECWTCRMPICDFCTMKQHWRDGHTLHWPLIDSKAFRVRLAKSEMEKKTQEDAKAYFLQDPNYRTQLELQTIRSFKCAAAEVYKRQDSTRQYDLRLARFYMWAQTDQHVILAVHVPTGYADRELFIQCDGRRLLVQSEGSPAVIDRQLSFPLAPGGIEVYGSTDSRFQILFLEADAPADAVDRLFEGDSDFCRRLEPGYTLYDVDDEVLLELTVPFWIDADDVRVQLTAKDVEIWVRNQLHIHRTFWTELGAVASQRKESTPAIDVSRSSWCLEDETLTQGRRKKLLSVSLVRPEPTVSEVEFKKGVRQDNKVERGFDAQRPGVRFFSDDQDDFGLEDLLQAACMKSCGQTFVPPKPWEKRESFRATNIADLSTEARRSYEALFGTSC